MVQTILPHTISLVVELTSLTGSYLAAGTPSILSEINRV